MKRLVLSKKEICTIPNLLTLIRILLVPVYMALLIVGSGNVGGYTANIGMVHGALLVMVIASVTDVFDGMIARKFNQGSYVGQLIDPVADKVMHVGALIALTVAGYIHWVFVVLLAAREFMMILVGSFILNKVNIKADMLGKVASCIISIGVIMSFFHPQIVALLNFEGFFANWGFDWFVIIIGLVLNWSAAIHYAIVSAKQIKADKAKEKEENALALEGASDEVVEGEQEVVEAEAPVEE